jgi:hypothetical protein
MLPGLGTWVHSRFSAVFSRSLFVLFLLTILLSVLRFTDSDYLFCIFKLFLHDHIISHVGKVWITLPSYWSAFTKSGEKLELYQYYGHTKCISWIGWVKYKQLKWFNLAICDKVNPLCINFLKHVKWLA